MKLQPGEDGGHKLQIFYPARANKVDVNFKSETLQKSSVDFAGLLSSITKAFTSQFAGLSGGLGGLFGGRTTTTTTEANFDFSGEDDKGDSWSSSNGSTTEESEEKVDEKDEKDEKDEILPSVEETSSEKESTDEEETPDVPSTDGGSAGGEIDVRLDMTTANYNFGASSTGYGYNAPTTFRTGYQYQQTQPRVSSNFEIVNSVPLAYLPPSEINRMMANYYY